MTGEFGRIKATMSDITTTPARDFHFTQCVLAALVDGDVRSRICFGCGDGRKKTSSATTDDGDMFLGVCGVERRDRHSDLKALANGDVADNTRMLVVDGERSCVTHRTVSHKKTL